MPIDPYKQALKETKDRFEEKKIKYTQDPDSPFTEDEKDEFAAMRKEHKRMEAEKAKEKKNGR